MTSIRHLKDQSKALVAQWIHSDRVARRSCHHRNSRELAVASLAKGRVLSKEIQCKSNLRQMSVALGVYLNDNEAHYPTYEWTAKERRFNWELAIARNTAGSSIETNPSISLHCPTGRQGVPHETVPGAVFSFSASPTYGYNSFGYVPPQRLAALSRPAEPSGLGGIKQSDESGITPTRESQLSHPADMLALGDGFRARTADAGTQSWKNLFTSAGCQTSGSALRVAWTSKNGREENLAEQRHAGRLNMAFTDGHVLSGKVEQWYFSEAETDLRRWRTDNQPK